MVQLQLYIEGQEVEMFKDESFTLTQSIQDIKDISKVFTDFSRTFNVPASKINNKLFKHFYNFNIAGFDARKKKDSTILINYKPFKEGKIKLEGVSLKNNEPESYKLTFYGNTVNLKDVLGEDLLSGLVNLTYFNFDYTDANIKSYLADGLDVNFFDETLTNAVIFPLITTNSRLIYDTSASNTDEIKNINPSGSSVNVGVPLNELKPAIRLYAIIKSIEEQYPEIQFKKDFFSQTNLPFYDLYMWLHNKEGKLFADQDAQYLISGFTPIEGGSNVIEGFKGGSFKNDFSEQNAKRELRIFVDPDTDVPYNVVIKKDGEEFKKFSNLSGNTINGEPSKADNIEIPNGTYTFYIETESSSSYSVDVRIIHKPKGILKPKKEILYRGSTAFATSKKINIPSLIPEMKVIDFITGLFKMFNLTAFVNLDGEIVVQTLDNYYSSSTTVWDITKDLDKNESVVDSILPFKEIDFKYESTGTFLAKNHKELAGKDWGSLSYKDGDKFDGKNYKITVPFEHMKFERLFVTTAGVVQTTTDSNGNTINQNSNIQFGYSVNENQNPYLTKPLLFYSGNGILSNIKVRSLDDQTISTVNSVYLPLNSQSTIFVGFEGQSLNYNEEFDEWNRKPVVNTMFSTYYKSYVQDMMDVRKRLSTFKAYLPMKMLHNLSLADRIIVFDDIYRINKITTDFSTNKSTLELTNIFEDLNYNSLLTIAGTSITIDLDNIFVDTIDITADSSGLTEGFDIPDITTDVPSEIPSNDPQPILEDEIISVTPPTLQIGFSNKNIEDEVYLISSVTELGKLINTPQIDEYGFIYSTTESDLDSTDVDTLKGVSGVTVVPFLTTSFNKFNLPPLASISVDGLTHPATIFYKFYGRTNTNSLYPTADAVTDIQSTQTVQSAVPVGNVMAWLTSIAVDPGTPPNIDCGASYPTTQFANWYFEHTGGARDLQVGDFIRTRGKIDYSGSSVHTSTYGGGLASFPEFTGYYAVRSSLNYFDFKILDENGGAYMAVRVERYTGKVVRVATCPSGYTFNAGGLLYANASANYFAGKSQQVGNLTCGNSYSESLTFSTEHNGSGNNPIVGDKIRNSDIIGGDFSGGASSFPSSFGQGFITITLTRVDPSDNTKVIGGYVVQVRTSDAEILEIYECP